MSAPSLYVRSRIRQIAICFSYSWFINRRQSRGLCQGSRVPKRSAGEDFYLLNKLAKVGDVVPLRGQAIRLSNRQSNRVPIGTGPAMHSLVSNLQANEWPTFYAPASFQTLGLLLSALNQITLPEQLGELQDPPSSTTSRARSWWPAI